VKDDATKETCHDNRLSRNNACRIQHNLLNVAFNLTLHIKYSLKFPAASSFELQKFDSIVIAENKTSRHRY